MEKIKFNQLFEIDKERLMWNFQRINRMFKNLEPIEMLTKFLTSQSVGASPDNIKEILNYYKPKITKDKTLLDFAFEWIRANNIRFNYKKFINLAEYENLNSAIDDVIFLFFLDYDNHIREFLLKDVSELEISALYNIFFNPTQEDSMNIDQFMSRNELRVKTIFKENKKMNTNIFTLREGLSSMITQDFNTLNSSKVEIKADQQEIEALTTIIEFDGAMLERLIKSYCFNNREIVERELESSISRFLSSFFRFGQFYKYEDFKDNMTQNLRESLYSGLTKNYKSNSLGNLINDTILNFEKTIEKHELDGLAWIKDLTPLLKKIAMKFINTLKD